MQAAIPHSYLFVPGNRPERFDKACSAGADAVIIDLEDAVPPAEKPAAREAVTRWLARERPVLVRINGPDTEWFAADLEICRVPGVAGIVLPKAERMDTVLHVAHVCESKPLHLLIETARGFADLDLLARAPCVQRLLFGSIDFQLDLGIEGDDEELLYFRSQLVLSSRIAGIPAPVDGVCTALDDTLQLREHTLRGRRLGFGGKLCIHPRQVSMVNQCFAPSADEIAWARRVLDAASVTQGAAVAVDGRMVDRPVILKAERIMSEAECVERRAQ